MDLTKKLKMLRKRSYCSTYAYAMGTTRYNNSYYLRYKEDVNWWLRSPGKYAYKAAYVNDEEGYMDMETMLMINVVVCALLYI